jgi:hypothetical protein
MKSIFIFFITLFLNIFNSCQNNQQSNDKINNCDYLYSNYCKDLTKKIKPIVEILEDSSLIVDERDDRKMGGVYYFNKDKVLSKYQFYLSDNKISYTKTSDSKNDFPLLSYSFFTDDKGRVNLGVMLSTLNNKIVNVFISKDNGELNKLKIDNYSLFSNVVFSKVLFNKYSLKELSKQKLYLYLEYLNCKGEKKTRRNIIRCLTPPTLAYPHSLSPLNFTQNFQVFQLKIFNNYI